MAAPAAVLNILVTANTTAAVARLRTVDTQMKATAGTSNKTLATINKFGKASAVAVGVAAAASVKFAVDFDKSMRNVNSIAQLNEKQFDNLRKRVLDLAGPTAQAPKTLAEGLYDLVSSGFNANQSIKILSKSARAATAGLTDTATSTKAVAAVLNAYRMPAKKAGQVSDVLFRTVDRGVITFDELASTIGDTLPFASQLGVRLHEVGASTATMTKQGLSGSETMTRIRNLLQTMIKPSTDLSAAFEELGVANGEALIKQEGFQGALEAIVGTTSGAKDEVAKLFPNIRALGGVLALTGGNSKAAADDLKRLKDSSGATNLALSEQSKSTAYQWQKLKATAQALMIQLGDKLLPVINTVIGFFAKNETALIALAAAIGVVAAAWVAMTIVMAVNPWVLVTAAIIAAAIVIIKNWDKIKGAFNNGVKFVKKHAVKFALGLAVITGGMSLLVVGVIKNWDKISGAFRAGVGAVKSILTKLVGFLKEVGKQIAAPIVSAARAIKSALQWIVNAVRRVISAFSDLKSSVPDISLPDLPSVPDINPFQRGGHINQGKPSGDSVPAMLERDEYVLNRKAVSKIGKRNLDAINFGMAPRYAKGGQIGRPMIRMGGPLGAMAQGATDQAREAANKWLKKHIGSVGATWKAIDRLAAQLGLSQTSTYRPGDPGFHGRRQAKDYSNGMATQAELKFGLRLAKSITPKLLELIHTPMGFSVDNGRRTAPFAQADHYDHVHVALAQKYARGGGVGKPRWGAHWIKGSDPKSRAGRKWDMSEAATLLSQVGMKWRDAEQLARKVPGESGGDPKIVSGDGGYGLWQITTPYNDDLIRKYGGFSAMRTPIPNAMAARDVYNRQGIGAWYAPTSGGKVSLLKSLVGKAGGAGRKKAPSKKSKMLVTAGLTGNTLTQSLGARVKQLEQLIAIWSDWADRAGATGGEIFGLTEAEHLGGVLNRLFVLRNTLVRLYQVYTTVVNATQKALKKAKKPKLRKRLAKELNAAKGARSSVLESLTGVQGLGSPMGLMTKLPAVGVLGGDILSTQMRLKELGESTTATDTAKGLSAAQLKELSHLSSLGVQFNPSQFAGFFARGGTIGSGQWGIAGERGPEIVQGPASVSPGPIYADIYIGGEKIDERVEVKLRRRDRAELLAHRAGG